MPPSHLFRIALILSIWLVASGCSGSQTRSCYYFPSCDREATRPQCETLDWNGNFVSIEILVGRVPLDVLRDSLGQVGGRQDSIVVKAESSDSVWWYAAGMEGLLAIQGCSVTSHMLFATGGE